MTAQDKIHVPALQRSLREIVEEYETKRASFDDLCTEYKALHDKVTSACCIGSTYAGRAFDYHPSLDRRRMESALLSSAWRHVYHGLNIHMIASAKDRQQFERGFENPPPFTLDNLRATFGDYLTDTRFHILKGLAECFIDLDPAYKSHSKVKIGVEGLPKRIIISGAMGQYAYGSWGREKLRDTLNALEVVRGNPHLSRGEFEDLVKTAQKAGECGFSGGKVLAFKNGNAHVVFDKPTLREINLALAEFYGDVLPDAENEGDAGPDIFNRPNSRAVSKDLQYYPTPAKVAAEILRDVQIDPCAKVLEPSCGCGRLMDEVRKIQPGADLIGIEYNPDRAEEARAKGHSVYQHNFLEMAPDPVFDLIVMNPPFYGLHWQKHLLHARKFLKPHVDDGSRWKRGGGQLICILPATAFWDGHLGRMGLVREDDHTQERGWRDHGWTDLPVASFAESGTNVPTGYFRCGADQ